MSLRELAECDLETILDWRNNPITRSKMFSQSIIQLDNHKTWFNRETKKNDSAWFMYIDANNNPTGVIYITDINWVANYAFWGLYKDPKAPKGTGTKMGTEALDYFFNVLGFHKINADVLESNVHSIFFHKKIGFEIEGIFRDHYFGSNGYETVTRFGLIVNEWAIHKAKFC